MSKEYFVLKQAESLEKIKAKMSSQDAAQTTNLNLLSEVSQDLDD